uniref:DUF2975 domain-containing protein n=2 Tax=uncultured organism TaxID=155900 RepID=A0A447I5P0_9ZZZZ|nr:FIG00403233: hypothetical protein [uncultured bacterium]VDS02628.1 FIG00403233: hypothetical protein [uncultured organism]VDS02659.1 FIG00403233: hypothetical protein [uncultured organism]
MKKRLNIFCACMIAAFLLSVSGNVYLIIEMFINGVEVGMKAAQGEITEIPQYKMVHVLPTDMMETTGTVTNLKDGRQLAVKPITAFIECPYPHSSHGFEVLQGLIGFIVIIGFVYATVYFAKLMIHINRNIVFDWINVKHLRRVGWSLTGMCVLSFISVWISNHQLAQCIELAGSKLNILVAFSDSTLILGFIALLASEVFAIGLRLKEENELTI